MTFYYAYILKNRHVLYPSEDLCARMAGSKFFIERQFHRPLSLREMAGNAFLSKYHYIRVFKSCYGRTPHRYLTEVRVAAAKKLLQTGMPVTQACFSVGFDSVTSFAGLFKKITGASPQACRRKALQESNFEEVQLPRNAHFYGRKHYTKKQSNDN